MERMVGERVVDCRKPIDYASKRHDGSSIAAFATSDGSPSLPAAERSLFLRELVLLPQQLVLFHRRGDGEEALQLLKSLPDLVRSHAAQRAGHGGVGVLQPAPLFQQLLQS